MSAPSAEKDALAERIRDARLDNLIEQAERASEPCMDCEAGEPHMCPNYVLPPGGSDA